MNTQPSTIQNMFSRIAPKYDLANTILSLGIHHLWKKKVVQISKAQQGSSVLDCATGTGDLALLFKQKVGTSGKVIATDFCAEMIILAPEKAKKKNLDIHFQQADVMNLPFADQSFDVVSISFGIRNVENPLQALKEMGRVCKQGGKIVVLEFGQIKNPVLAPIYQFYSQKILPHIGGFITGEKKAYQYLEKSSATFPCREDFLKLIKSSHFFKEEKYLPLSGGLAYIYSATRL